MEKVKKSRKKVKMQFDKMKNQCILKVVLRGNPITVAG